eukprot:1143952-Pelagomonas_calceolata.AAC.3
MSRLAVALLDLQVVNLVNLVCCTEQAWSFCAIVRIDNCFLACGNVHGEVSTAENGKLPYDTCRSQQFTASAQKKKKVADEVAPQESLISQQQQHEQHLMPVSQLWTTNGPTLLN